MDKQPLFGISLLVALLIGASGMWVYQVYHGQTESPFSNTFPNATASTAATPLLGRSQSPYVDIEQLQRDMDKTFGGSFFLPDFNRGFYPLFDRNAFEQYNLDDIFANNTLTSIRTEEDSKHLFYVLDVDGKELTNFVIDTGDGQVSINAELIAKNPNMTSATTLQQSFPIPATVDPESIHVEQSDEEIRVRFSKKA